MAAAMRAYRGRRSLYNGPTEQPLQRWGVQHSSDAAHALAADARVAAGEPPEHRSGVGGVPFFNLVERMDEATLAAGLRQMLRAEWLPDYDGYDDAGELPGLEAALRRAATPHGRKVILTFANLGYADFVVNGFASTPAAKHTLVVALDADAHATFQAAGLVSFYEPRMPSISSAAASHLAAAFMDVMKLRLLYLAEVLVLGYSALLTDADAVFFDLPFAAFPPSADLVVACDATVVPRDWREAPGMVMAGFFFARAGVRPLIFVKEVLDYQARHPELHDQQSLNQILSELLVADLQVAVMHPRLFPNGFQYFVKRTVQREGGAPLVVQNNWLMGADNKRHRFREAGLWTSAAGALGSGHGPAAPRRLL
eukprot:3520025-Prymnesium_polylepis.1